MKTRTRKRNSSIEVRTGLSGEQRRESKITLQKRTWQRRRVSWLLLPLVVGLITIDASVLQAAPAPVESDAEVIRAFMRELGFHPKLEEQLRAGQILTTGMPEMENTELELAVSAVMLLVRRNPEVVIEAYMDGEAFRTNPRVLQWQTIDNQLQTESDIQDSFSAVGFTAQENAETAALLSGQPQKSFNLSQVEFDQLTAQRVVESAADASEQYRSILIGRYQSYLENGQQGIASYVRPRGKSVKPGDDLALAVESFEFIEPYFPDFYEAVLKPPTPASVLGENIEQRFFWLKQITGDRPNFVLTHNVAHIETQHSIAIEKQFYVGHSYNAMVGLIGCLPFEGNTVVFFKKRGF
jgi:hypothetical protein